MKKLWMIGAGVVGVLVGMGFVMPAAALLRDKGALPTESVALLILGLTLTLGGGVSALFGAMRARA